MSRSGYHRAQAERAARREDTTSNTVEDAAAHERWRGQAYDTDPREYDRPTRAEIEAEERDAR